MRSIFCFLFLLVFSQARATPAFVSAHREEFHSWERAARWEMQRARHWAGRFYQRYLELNPVHSLVQPLDVSQDNDDAYSLRKTWDQMDKNAVPMWPGDQESMVQNFEKVRDLRFLEANINPGFKRRVPWLYPDDGCFMRADWTDRLLQKWGIPNAAKVYAFGDLQAKTNNTPTGTVTWWYHVAMGYRLGDEIYIFDPALEPTHPLPIKEWIQIIAPNAEQTLFSVCDAKSSSPFVGCKKPVPVSNDDLIAQGQDFLNMEWERALELKRDPHKILGDEPPWKNPEAPGSSTEDNP